MLMRTMATTKKKAIMINMVTMTTAAMTKVESLTSSTSTLMKPPMSMITRYGLRPLVQSLQLPYAAFLGC